MLLTVLGWFCSSLLAAACGGKLPDPEVKVEVLHRPFLCHRKSKYGDILLVHHEGYFENGTRFYNRYASDLFLHGYKAQHSIILCENLDKMKMCNHLKQKQKEMQTH